MKWKAILLLTIASFSFLNMAEGDMWVTLEDVRFTVQYNDELGYDVEVPIFGSKVKALNRKEVVVSGFIIPLDGGAEADHFWLSRYPLQSCFFCGKAGPETVIEVYTKKDVPISKKKVTLKGKFQLNYDNLEQMIYIMQDVTQID